MALNVGEMFVLGFHGRSLPDWIVAFEERFGLGGVILFDRDVHTHEARNIESPEQVSELCASVHELGSRPLVLVDQEGGLVRRLKPEKGFRDLPSAARFAELPIHEARSIAYESYSELKGIGIDVNLAPVVDLDTNPHNPNIGALGRSFSSSADEVRRCVEIVMEAAERTGLQLCLKHYPGLGGVTTDSHDAVTALEGVVSEEQLALFVELCSRIRGKAILVSHAIVEEWDRKWPVSVSETAIREIRRRAQAALLITDDLQMVGLRALCSTREATLKSLRAGVDLVCIGNNLRDEQSLCMDVAEALQQAAARDEHLRTQIVSAQRRVQLRKDWAEGSAARPAEQ